MLKDFLSSIKAYWEAWTILVDKKLWLYLWIPGLISLVYGLVVGVSIWYFSDNVRDFVFTILPSDSNSKIWTKISSGLLSFGMATTGVVVYKYIIMIILSPLLSSLSRRVEEAVAGYSMSYQSESDATAWQDLLRAAGFGFRQFIKEILITFVILLIGLVPILGFLVGPLVWIVQAMYAGFFSMDFSLNRYFSAQGSGDYIRKNLGFSLGIGAVFMLLVMIPVIGLFFAPSLSVAAATLKTIPRVYRTSFA
jgi:CysZ protein